MEKNINYTKENDEICKKFIDNGGQYLSLNACSVNVNLQENIDEAYFSLSDAYFEIAEREFYYLINAFNPVLEDYHLTEDIRPNNVFSVIYRLYLHSTELRLKGLICPYEAVNGHSIIKLFELLKIYYLCSESLEELMSSEFISDRFTLGSETGRYPVSSKGNIIGREKNRYIAVDICHMRNFFSDLHRMLGVSDPCSFLRPKRQKE